MNAAASARHEVVRDAMVPAIPRSLVTGASGGLGAALARRLARPGVALVLVARDAARLDAVARECRARGAQVETAVLDVRASDVLAAFVASADADHPIDAVYANAGVEASVGAGRAAEAFDDVTAQLRTNLEGAIATVLPLIEPMRARGSGRVVLIASLAGLMPLPDQPTYCATKAGLIAYGEALRPMLGAYGVTVTVACPGFIATGMARGYRGWRPFEWSAEKAAAHIVAAAERGARRVAFPWPLVGLIRLGRLVPAFMREPVLKSLFRADIEPMVAERTSSPPDNAASEHISDESRSLRPLKKLSSIER
ncbi:SDR family NAD(P)-dependent oxidoreductase [Ancylobacter sp. 6x-1]|uniref:SDR family NAD(P)-dependent oxidoreductase n=1 Tax=Ancylobacter crimeensis TaxID=2579147 RepID=A0ABT0DAN6_9HYPH|nr:SDR family NAD(P)-dependent oxidoreductase [Ancylobacter crimeensis]MCK0197003.1 SDR family NAD(P)-dependent oxidoreductase [Ancylobacter crimeensis]